MLIHASTLFKPVSTHKEIQVVEVPVYKYCTVQESFEVSYSPREREILAGVIHSEAGNQDQIGKRLVVDVILNRVDAEDFPNNILDVVKQEGQFTEPSTTYTADDMRAVDAELKKRLDYDILWFRTDKYHKYGEPAYQHGDHYFSRWED